MTELTIVVLISVAVVAVSIPLVKIYLPLTVWSPVYGFVAVYLIIGSLGYICYKYTPSYMLGFYNLHISEGELTKGAAGFLIALASFLVGVCTYLVFSRKLKRLSKPPIKAQAFKQRGRSMHAITRGINWILFVPLCIPALLFVVGKGPENIWSRNVYLIDEYHFVYIAASMLSFPALLAAGYILPKNKSILWRFSSISVLILYVILFLSASTRRVIIAPLVFIIGLAFAGVQRRTVFVLLAVWFVSLPLLSAIPLGLRGMPEQGLAPLLSNIGLILSRGMGVDYFESAMTLTRNITFGVPVTGYVTGVSTIPKDYFVVSIQPLPSFVDIPGLPPWSNFKDQLRVNDYVPFSAIGELLNQGWIYLVAYYVIVGLITAWVDVNTRFFQARHRNFWGFLIACGMLDTFAIISTQYNLRSATRFVYYAVFITIVWGMLCRVRFVFRHR